MTEGRQANGELKDCERCGGRYSEGMQPVAGYVCKCCRGGDRTKRKPNWPYSMETTRPTDKTNSIKTVVAVMVTVLLSAWFGFWMANGL